MVLYRLSHIRNCITWQVVEIHPTQVVAFIRLGIDDLALPMMDLHEEIDALIALDAMHDRREKDIVRFDSDPDLFLCLTSRRGSDSFIPIQMPCRDAVFAIAIARVETASDKDLILANKKQMDSNRECCAHIFGMSL